MTSFKKPLVIYHGNCADGFSAAWCFHDHAMVHSNSEERYEFYAGTYGKPPPDVTNRIVYLVDFSYKREVVKAMCAVAEEVILIDHHKTAIDDLGFLVDQGSDEFQPNFSWFVDMDRSGAMLAWDYLFNPEGSKPGDPEYVAPPRLLDHIQDRDLWKFKLPNTRDISAAVFSYEYTFENWDKLMFSDAAALLHLTLAGAAIERKHHKDIAELLKQTQRNMEIGGWYVPCANLPYTLASDAGSIMAKDHEFAATYYDTHDHRCFSLRSDPDTDGWLDVAKIAEKYGGGGHKHAAGFKVSRSHPLAQM